MIIYEEALENLTTLSNNFINVLNETEANLIQNYLEELREKRVLNYELALYYRTKYHEKMLKFPVFRENEYFLRFNLKMKKLAEM